MVATEESRDGGMMSKEKQWETEVRRFCGRSHSPCGGLVDSAVEAGIIKAILWVSVIITLVHILNIQ